MAELTTLFQKTIRTLRQDGAAKVGEKAVLYLKQRKQREAESQVQDHCFQDVLFINGCDEHLPHPGRYRVSHQREQLESLGYSTGEVYYQNLRTSALRCYRQFVIFRCPWTKELSQFILEARKLHKTVLYDIDDLVIDTRYTDQIPYLDQMSSEERQAYDANVTNMGRLLAMCDGAVTTTEALAAELSAYVPEVMINRNVASEEMVMLSVKGNTLEHRKNSKEKAYMEGINAPKYIKNTDKKVSLGYFSGSITHNDDFAMILPVLRDLLDQYPALELHLVGELTLPEELKACRNQVIQHPFVDWRSLPELIAGVDINLAPVRDTLFNRAKSENKWVEAALVQVPTVASDVGAFHSEIQHGVTGYLCSSEADWKNVLRFLIEQPQERRKTGHRAFSHCMEHCLTSVTGMKLKQFFDKKSARSIGFILPAFQISGGVMVALKHASLLKKYGWDVTLFSIEEGGKESWFEFEGINYPVVNLTDSFCPAHLTCAVATMWSTVAALDKLPNAGEKAYLVQNYEPDFYQPGDPLRMEARKTYQQQNLHYLTISQWCRNWLQQDYHRSVSYAPNGLETGRFAGAQRKLSAQGSLIQKNNLKQDSAAASTYRKIRILIEGDSSAAHKRVDESFRIVKNLDPDRFEIWYLAYHGQPKSWYRVDRFLREIPYAEVDQIYRQCDILLKSSILESFSYPPLEMMCSGGYVIAVQNDGNKEYLQDQINALCYRPGRIQEAVDKIEALISDQKLQDTLYENGTKTALLRDWDSLESQILDLYNHRVEEM